LNPFPRIKHFLERGNPNRHKAADTSIGVCFVETLVVGALTIQFLGELARLLESEAWPPPERSLEYLPVAIPPAVTEELCTAREDADLKPCGLVIGANIFGRRRFKFTEIGVGETRASLLELGRIVRSPSRPDLLVVGSCPSGSRMLGRRRDPST
jgi:hypothetical protein